MQAPPRVALEQYIKDLRRARCVVDQETVRARAHAAYEQRMRVEAIRASGDAQERARLTREELTLDTFCWSLASTVFPLVIRVTGSICASRRLERTGIPFEELVSEGNIGAYCAAKRFEPRRGVKYSTFSLHWIGHYVKRAIQNDASPLRVPSGERTRLEALSELRQRSGAEHESLFPRRVPLFLTGENGEEYDRPLDALQQPEAGHDRQLTSDAILHRVAQVGLSPRQREILSKRFGLEDGEEHNLQAIASDLSVTGERVRQLEASAIRKIRRYFDNLGIRSAEDL